jgi:hypothetical protein
VIIESERAPYALWLEFDEVIQTGRNNGEDPAVTSRKAADLAWNYMRGGIIRWREAHGNANDGPPQDP